MVLIAQELISELSDNWPAFTYIALTVSFSIFFIRERRLETREVRRAGASLQHEIHQRFERLEALVREHRPASAIEPPFTRSEPRSIAFRPLPANPTSAVTEARQSAQLSTAPPRSPLTRSAICS